MATEQNTRTLIATFNDYGTARQAARDLMDNGVPADAIKIDSDRKTAGAGSGSAAANDEMHESGFASWWHGLFGAGRDEDERATYERALASGSALLRATVPSSSVETAADILNRDGAIDVERASNMQQASDKDVNREAGASGNRGNAPIQVIEEELQVGKRAVRRGGVRIYSHVVDRPVEQKVDLHEEHVNVERRKVDREASPAELSRLKDQTIEVTEMAEEPVVAKRARVREEVVVGKESSDRTETVRDNVRHTEVEVERLGPDDAGRTTRNEARNEVRRNEVRNEARNDARNETATGPVSGRAPMTGPSSNAPSPGVLSGGGMTPGQGTLAGEATAGSAVQDYTAQDFTSDYRRNFDQTYGAGSDFETMRPAYEYGYRNAGDPRYKGKSWTEAENDIRSDYERNHPGSKWDQVKNAVRYGWEKMTR